MRTFNSSMLGRRFLFVVAIGATSLVGCASDGGEAVDEDLEQLDESLEASYERPLEEGCRRTYSPVVPVYIDYRDVHCDGWTGKVFCEYESLSSTYGPGWGTCQCYRDFCEKGGRVCRVRSGRRSC